MPRKGSPGWYGSHEAENLNFQNSKLPGAGLVDLSIPAGSRNLLLNTRSLAASLRMA